MFGSPRVKSRRRRLSSRVEVNRPSERKPSAVKCYRREGQIGVRGWGWDLGGGWPAPRVRRRECHSCSTIAQEAVKADEEHERRARRSREAALKAAKVIKAAQKVKIFSLSSCQDALILHRLRLPPLGRYVTCLRPQRAVAAERTADFPHLQSFFSLSAPSAALWLSGSGGVRG